VPNKLFNPYGTRNYLAFQRYCPVFGITEDPTVWNRSYTFPIGRGASLVADSSRAFLGINLNFPLFRGIIKVDELTQKSTGHVI
jgi:hypothetical protein